MQKKKPVAEKAKKVTKKTVKKAVKTTKKKLDVHLMLDILRNINLDIAPKDFKDDITTLYKDGSYSMSNYADVFESILDNYFYNKVNVPGFLAELEHVRAKSQIIAVKIIVNLLRQFDHEDIRSGVCNYHELLGAVMDESSVYGDDMFNSLCVYANNDSDSKVHFRSAFKYMFSRIVKEYKTFSSFLSRTFKDKMLGNNEYFKDYGEMLAIMETLHDSEWSEQAKKELGKLAKDGKLDILCLLAYDKAFGGLGAINAKESTIRGYVEEIVISYSHKFAEDVRLREALARFKINDEPLVINLFLEKMVSTGNIQILSKMTMRIIEESGPCILFIKSSTGVTLAQQIVKRFASEPTNHYSGADHLRSFSVSGFKILMETLMPFLVATGSPEFMTKCIAETKVSNLKAVMTNCYLKAMQSVSESSVSVGNISTVFEKKNWMEGNL